MIGEDDDQFDELDPTDTSREDKAAAQERELKRLATVEIEKRRGAYCRVFSGLGSRDDVDTVMLDLAQFCRLFRTPWHPDARTHALLTGRNEVAQRILDFTRLDRDALFRKYNGSQ